tara:strand:- start:211 stop:855 length:645 start_codon:yes stop_codon:yes gene_type:complete
MVVSYRKNIQMMINHDQENICSICFNELEGNNICRTNCNHLFCFECLCHHVMSGANPSCPCCRGEFVSNDFISSIRRNNMNHVNNDLIDTPSQLERQDTSVYPLIRNFADDTDIYLNGIRHHDNSHDYNINFANNDSYVAIVNPNNELNINEVNTDNDSNVVTIVSPNNELNINNNDLCDVRRNLIVDFDNQLNENNNLSTPISTQINNDLRFI